MDELKPCPFCGGEDTVVREDSQVWTGQRYNVLSWVVEHFCEGDTYTNRIARRAKTRQDAIDLWNTRV